MTPGLRSQTCQACTPQSQAVSEADIERFRPQIPGWEIIEREGQLRLEKSFSFPDFQSALAFTNAVGAEAEAQGHHPALLTEWGKVTVSWWTHAIGGLHENDFILAAKTDGIRERLP